MYLGGCRLHIFFLHMLKYSKEKSLFLKTSFKRRKVIPQNITFPKKFLQGYFLKEKKEQELPSLQAEKKILPTPFKQPNFFFSLNLSIYFYFIKQRQTLT
eukprot:TRINITY_DN33448_c0_g1_i3.p6 TRINITY_DN33448_c0_g1~~TRINITY_DN33448_c0_g1_i3.p6  ORF type:complete len:100 (-),score=3.76 TRINITY_DN33448_c0_g1_i3:713-1012(-)